MAGPILIVDDDEASLGWVVEALQLAGYETVTATNGAEALRCLRGLSAPPSVILLDLMMPIMDGWDVIASLMRQPDRPKVIVMSAYCKEGIPAGADAVLRKPLDCDTVIAAVRAWYPAPRPEAALA